MMIYIGACTGDMLNMNCSWYLEIYTANKMRLSFHVVKDPHYTLPCVHKDSDVPRSGLLCVGSHGNAVIKRVYDV